MKLTEKTLRKIIREELKSINEARTVSKPIKVNNEIMVQIVGDNKGFRELTAALNPKTGKPIQKFGYDRGNEIADSKEELVKKLQKKYGKSIKFESVNEANVVGKAVFDDGKGKLAFGYYKDDDEVALVDYKTWKKLNFKDVSKGDTNKDRLVKAILRKQKQFNKKVEYNTWSKKTNPSFEEKMDWFIKNGWISNVTKRGIKESIREAKGKPTSKVKRNGSWWRLTVDWPNGDISIKDYKSEKAAKGAEKEFHKLHKAGKIRDNYAFNHSGYLDFSPNDYKWSIAVKMPRMGMTRKEYFDSLSDALKWGKKNIHNFDRDQVEAPIRK